MFNKGSFIVKNLPTPFSVRGDLPPIEVSFYNGTGGENYRDDEYMMYATVMPSFIPAQIDNFGTIFSEALFPQEAELSEQTLVNVIDLYFTPTVAIWNCSSIEILFPKEISLPVSITSVDEITA